MPLSTVIVTFDVSEFRLHDSDIVKYGDLYDADEEITIIARNYWTQEAVCSGKA